MVKIQIQLQRPADATLPGLWHHQNKFQPTRIASLKSAATDKFIDFYPSLFFLVNAITCFKVQSKICNWAVGVTWLCEKVDYIIIYFSAHIIFSVKKKEKNQLSQQDACSSIVLICPASIVVHRVWLFGPTP